MNRQSQPAPRASTGLAVQYRQIQSNIFLACWLLLLLAGCGTFPGAEERSIVSPNVDGMPHRFNSEAEASAYARKLQQRVKGFSSSDPQITLRSAKFVPLRDSRRGPLVESEWWIGLEIEYSVSATARPGKHEMRIVLTDESNKSVASASLKTKVFKSKARAMACTGIILLLTGLYGIGLGVSSIKEAGPFALLLIVGSGLATIAGIVCLCRALLALFI